MEKQDAIKFVKIIINYDRHFMGYKHNIEHLFPDWNSEVIEDIFWDCLDRGWIYIYDDGQFSISRAYIED